MAEGDVLLSKFATGRYGPPSTDTWIEEEAPSGSGVVRNKATAEPRGLGISNGAETKRRAVGVSST
jgi:hypothetical protein